MKDAIYPFLFLCLAMMLVSCGKSIGTEDRYDENTAYRGGTKIVYDGVFYIFQNSAECGYPRLDYYVLPRNKKEALEEPEIYPQCVCADTLCTHTTEECPAVLRNAAYGMVVADREASEKRGSPVLFISYSYYIARYIVGENRREEVIRFDNGLTDCTSMWIYRDYLYIVGKDMDGKAAIFRVDKDTGKNLISFLPGSGEELAFTIIGFYDDYLYYRNTMAEIYRVRLDLTDSRLLVSTKVDFNGIIQNGYVYYCRNIIDSDLCTDALFQTVELYRRKLGKGDEVFAGEEEYIDEDIMMFLNPFVFPTASTKVLYTIINPRKVGVKETKKFTGETIKIGYYRDGTEKMRYIDTETGEKGILYEDFGANLQQFIYANDQYVVLADDEYYKDENDEWDVTGSYYYYDYKNDIKVRLPDRWQTE